MRFAGDRPPDTYTTWRKHPVVLDDLVQPLSVDATPEEVAVFYAQAAEMYEFLERLCLGVPDCTIQQLVQALTRHDTVPEELFLWATEERGGSLIETGPLAFWQAYERLGNFDPKTLDALLARARPR